MTQKKKKSKGAKDTGTPEKEAQLPDPIKDAVKTKTACQEAMQTAGGLVRMIEAKDAPERWKYFQDQLGPTKAALREIEEGISGCNFIQHFLTTKKATGVAKRYSIDTYRHNCESMVRTLQPLITKASKETALLTNMKLARDRTLD